MKEITNSLTAFVNNENNYFDFNTIPFIDGQDVRGAFYSRPEKAIVVGKTKLPLSGVSGKGASLFNVAEMNENFILLSRSGQCANIERAVELNSNRTRIYATQGVHSNVKYAFDRLYKEQMEAKDWFENTDNLDLVFLTKNAVGLKDTLWRRIFINFCVRRLGLDFKFKEAHKNGFKFRALEFLTSGNLSFSVRPGVGLFKRALDLLSTSFLNLLSKDSLDTIEHARRLHYSRDLVKSLIGYTGDTTYKRMSIRTALRELNLEGLMSIVDYFDKSNLPTSIAYVKDDGSDRGRFNEIILALSGTNVTYVPDEREDVHTYMIDGDRYLLSRRPMSLQISHECIDFVANAIVAVYILAESKFVRDDSGGFFVVSGTEMLKALEANVILRRDNE